MFSDSYTVFLSDKCYLKCHIGSVPVFVLLAANHMLLFACCLRDSTI